MIIGITLAHLARWIVQRHDARTNLANLGLRNGEHRLSVYAVEALRQVTGELDMLALIFWIYRYGERVQVNDTEDVIILRLRFLPVAQGTQVVAQVQFTCWLYSRKDTLFHFPLRTWRGRLRFHFLVRFDWHGYISID